jgi:hypothetical protein
VQCDPSGQLAELQVVADHHGDGTVLGVDDRRQRIARGEDQLLAVPQVSLAIAGKQPVGVDHHGTVVEPCVVTQFAEATDDDRIIGGGRPFGERRVCRGERCRPSFVNVGEHVAGCGELRQHDDVGADLDSRTDLRLDQFGIGRQPADRGFYLAACDPDHGGRVREPGDSWWSTWSDRIWSTARPRIERCGLRNRNTLRRNALR